MDDSNSFDSLESPLGSSLMYTPCLWYREELQRQIDALDPQDASVILEATKAPPFLAINMPNKDVYEFDICLLHGHIRGLGKKHGQD